MNTAIITINENIRKIGYFGRFIKREEKYINNTKISVYSIAPLSLHIAKKLIKILKKDNIKKLAVDERIPRKLLKIPEDFEIVTVNKVFRKNIIPIIKKISKILGLKKGNLSLGMTKTDIPLNIFFPLRRDLKTLFLYSEREDAEMFYKETGIPVITKMFPEENECHILIIDKEFEIDIPKSVKYIVEIGESDLNESRCISDIRLKNYEKNLFKGVKKCVVNELVGGNSDIAGFVKKTLDTSC